MTPLEGLKNFGPYMIRTLNQIGIHSQEDLIAADYRELQSRLIEHDIVPHLNFFYSIEMGLQDRTWNSITPAERRELKMLLQREG